MSTNTTPKIILYRGWDDYGKYVWSPFATKLEFRLRTSNLPYTCGIGSTNSGPKGKIPYITLSLSSSSTSQAEEEEEEAIGDSALIISRLIDEGMLDDVNAHLSPAQKGQDLAIRALLEEKLYFYHTKERWIGNYYEMRDHTLWSLPWPLRVVVGYLAYRGNVRKLHDQGTGRFSDAELLAFKKEIWEGVSGMLEDGRRKMGERGGGGDGNGGVGRDGEGGCWWVLGGDGPTEADAVLYGFVVSVLICDAGPESRELVKGQFPGVVEWAERVHRTWFPDYEMW